MKNLKTLQQYKEEHRELSSNMKIENFGTPEYIENYKKRNKLEVECVVNKRYLLAYNTEVENIN